MTNTVGVDTCSTLVLLTVKQFVVMAVVVLPSTDFSFIFVCVFCAAIAATDAECPRPRKIDLALLQPLDGELGFERTAAASTMAVKDAQAKGLLNGTVIE